MKENNVEKILRDWNEKYGENGGRYGSNTLNEIAVNCVSLSETWFNRQNKKEFSFEIFLYDNDGAVVETLEGINDDNLPSTMFNIIVLHSNDYSKLSLMRFKYVNGSKTTELVGELEIS